MTMKFQTDCSAGMKILQKLLFVRHVIEHLLGQTGGLIFLPMRARVSTERGVERAGHWPLEQAPGIVIRMLRALNASRTEV
jgi:hypothetical protein